MPNKSAHPRHVRAESVLCATQKYRQARDARNALYPKSQSAIEYLMTYSWAILIIAIVLGAVFALGVFNFSTYVHNSCVLPNSFSCETSVLSENGILFVNIEQSTQDPINITSMACNTNQTTAHSVIFPKPVTLPIGGNATFDVQCYSGDVTFFGVIGQAYDGYLTINYTDINTGFNQIAAGTVSLKVQSLLPITTTT